MLYDNHIHVINQATTPPEIAAGRFRITEAEMHLIHGAAWAVQGTDWPDEIDAAAMIIDAILKGLSPRYKRLRRLLALYFMPLEKYMQIVKKMMIKNWVEGANVLLISGTPPEAIRHVQRLCEGTNLQVFIPWEYAEPGQGGIKFYPSLRHEFMKLKQEIRHVAEIACRHDTPIISHCSPGGVRGINVTEGQAKSANLPGWWSEILQEYPVRLCLAHGGGGKKWVNFMNCRAPGPWALDYMMREACPPSEWPGRLWIDTAYHDDQGSDQYMTAAQRAEAPWRVLWGSDWPLHLGEWSYSQACEWGRRYWGDQMEEQRKFLGGSL